MPTAKGQSPERKGRLGTMRARSDENKLWGFVGRNSKGQEGEWADLKSTLLEWCLQNTAGEEVPGIPHLLNTDWWMAHNSWMNSTYIQAAVQQVPGILHPLNMDGWMAGNSLVNARYIQAAACRIWVTPMRSNSFQNGVHGKPLLNGQKAGNSLINAKYTKGAAYGQKAGNSLINAKYTKGAAYGQKAGNSLINGTYILGAACEIWVTQISSDSCWNEWCPWKATVEKVPRIPHPLNADGQKAGNSLINGTYILGAACEVWITQIGSNSCQNGVHGKLLRGCWGCHIHSMWMGRWLAIV
ncbi:hypothetical protein F5J12DRAFT_786337 [Pisolithus orientalis]|uniref:uncharacterized protein n=1 Tax=Pisolithus orientalis TaxID=936130 RepID=UPI0022245E43|nr:uncharacterized protein F5J12DRAFT_786337 [Pisolithus orientalis]KAI5991696.1 hypothetical protein F5J12DRAFT_786337 [Pisolithus orientalis]